MDGGWVFISVHFLVWYDMIWLMQAPFVAAGGVGIIVAGIVLQLIPDKPRAIVSTTPRNTSGDASFTSLAAGFGL